MFLVSFWNFTTRDAWDTDIFHLETPTHLKFTSVRVAETGPLRASLAVKVQFGQSVIDCIVSTYGVLRISIGRYAYTVESSRLRLVYDSRRSRLILLVPLFDEMPEA